MSKADNSTILAAVKAWQEDETIHPLTCGTDSNHRPLVAVERDGKVVLTCLDCDYVQTNIPDCVIKAHFEGMHEERRKMFGEDSHE